jgi:hypothetical protein
MAAKGEQGIPHLHVGNGSARDGSRHIERASRFAVAVIPRRRTDGGVVGGAVPVERVYRRSLAGDPAYHRHVGVDITLRYPVLVLYRPRQAVGTAPLRRLGRAGTERHAFRRQAAVAHGLRRTERRTAVAAARRRRTAV